MWHDVDWYLAADVSGEPVLSLRVKQSKKNCLDYLTFAGETNRMCRNVGKKLNLRQLKQMPGFSFYRSNAIRPW